MIRWLLLVASILIFAMGLVMIFSTSSAEVIDQDLTGGTHGAFLKQLFFGSVAALSFLWISQIDFRKILRHSPKALVLLTCALVLVLIPGIGKEVNGSKRWLSLVGFSFQPSEFLKLTVLAYFVHYGWNGRHLSLRHFFVLIFQLSIPLFLVMIEPNNGTVAVIAAVLVALCFLAQISWRFWALPLLCFAALGTSFAFKLPYVQGRIKSYLNPESDLRGKGHQPYQAKIAAGSGGLIGRGPGNSLQKLSYLPEAQNDYIAAIFAEEFGFLGISSLIFLYMTLATLGYAVAMRAKDPRARLLAASYTFLIALQAFLNLAVVSGLLPSTGLNLPFFSQGGSSLIANALALGVLWSIASDEQENYHNNRRDRRAHLSLA